jgi:hypothetical protein
MDYNHYYSIADCFTLVVRSAIDLDQDPNTLLRLGAFLPDIKRIDDYSRPSDVVVDHIYGAQSRVESHSGNVTITTVNESDASEESQIQTLPEDIYHLLYGVVRKELIEQKSLYCVHAACVGEGQDFRLLVGHSGSGKTTLAQDFLDAGRAKLFSGNKTILQFKGDGSVVALGGTKTMTALDQNTTRYAYTVDADQRAEAQTVPITSIDIIRLNDGVKQCEELSPKSALHTLYPLVMDQVNADVVIGDGTSIYDGDVSKGAKEILMRNLTKATQNIPTRKVTGSRSYLARTIL